MKLKINIKKYLILLVVGFIASSSFLVIPQKTHAGEQTNQGGNTTPAPSSTTPATPPAATDGKDLALGSFSIKTTSYAKEYRIVKDTNAEIRYKLEFTGSVVPRLGIDKLDINSGVNGDPYIRSVYLGINFAGLTKIDCLDGKDLANPIKDLTLACALGDLHNSHIAYLNPLPTGDQILSNIDYATYIGKNLNTDEQKKLADGQPVSKNFVLFPILDLDYNNIDSLVCGASCWNTDKALTDKTVPITITVYPTEDALKAAGAPTDAAHPQEFGGPVDATSSTTQSDVDKTGLGKSLADFIAQVIGTIVSYINEFIYFVTAQVIAPTMEYLLGIRTYTDAFASVILPGWEVLRNLANIFFIVVMLIIALATLFRVQNYQYKNLLISLILAALLVNFSLVIAQGVLGIAETVQDQFLPVTDAKDPTHGTSHNVIATLANQLMLEPIKSFNTLKTTNKDLVSSLSSITLPIFYLILAVIGFITLLSLLVFILIRIVMLWILLMLSPIPYVAGVLPVTKSYRAQWWREFIKYAFFVAIIGFFLNIAAYLAQNQQKVFAGLSANSSNLGSLEQFILQIGTNLMLIVFIFAGLKFASSAGVYGAKAVTDAVTKGTLKPFRLARDGVKLAGGRIGEGIGNKTGFTLSPSVWKKDFEKYTAELKEAKEKRLNKRKEKGFRANPYAIFDTFGTGDGLKRVKKGLTERFKYDKGEEKELTEKSKLLTEDERKQKLIQQQELDSKNNLKQNNKISGGSPASKAISDGIDTAVSKLDKEIAEKEEQAKSVGGMGPEIQALKDKRAELLVAKDHLDKLVGSEDQSVLFGLANNPENKKELEDIVNSIKAGFEKSSQDAQREITELSKIANDDDELRAKFGFGKFEDVPVDPANYKQVDKDVKDKITEALSQQESYKNAARNIYKTNYGRKDQVAGEREQQKKWDDLGYEEAKQFVGLAKEAFKDKDFTKFSAATKWLAKDGSMGDLLTEFGKSVDAQGVQGMLTDLRDTLKLTDEQMYRFGAEIGKLNGSNKQLGLSKIVHVGLNGPARFNTPAEHEAAISGSFSRANAGEIADMHKYAFVSETKGTDGKMAGKLSNPAKQALASLRTDDDALTVTRKMKQGAAKAISEAEGFNDIQMNPKVKEAILKRAAKAP